MRLKMLIAGALVLACGVVGAQVEPDPEGYTVEVTFADKLQKRLVSINNVEQRLEKQFREDRHYQRGITAAGTQRSAKIDTAGTAWAGERLIENPDDFTLENLIKAMVAYNVNRAAPGFQGRIEVELNEIGLSNAPVASIARNRSYAAGNITVRRSDGSVQFSGPVKVNLVVDPVADRSYDGPELAFTETDPPKRVGPTLAYFIERALEKAWPGHEDEIVGPVVVQVSEPGERVVQRDFNF